MPCPIHGSEWKTIPAGVSKTTGKPYNAFQACPERGCKEKPPKAHGSYPSTQTTPAPVIVTGQSEAILEVLTRIAIALERISNKDLDSIPFGN